jgi:ssDNA thymidine ADP-ribosyltransferase, DarT
VDRTRVTELHSLQSIANIPSIVTHGILSYKGARAVAHASIANEDVQARRDVRVIPGDGRVHDHACLFFNARTPMLIFWLYQGRSRDSFVVVRIDPAILDLPDVKVTDGNAASSRTRFYPSPAGLDALDEADVYAEWWTDPDPAVKEEKKRKRSAEVLVPDVVPPQFIRGFIVHSEDTQWAVQAAAPGYPVDVDPGLFFG